MVTQATNLRASQQGTGRGLGGRQLRLVYNTLCEDRGQCGPPTYTTSPPHLTSHSPEQDRRWAATICEGRRRRGAGEQRLLTGGFTGPGTNRRRVPWPALRGVWSGKTPNDTAFDSLHCPGSSSVLGFG